MGDRISRAAVSDRSQGIFLSAFGSDSLTVCAHLVTLKGISSNIPVISRGSSVVEREPEGLCVGGSIPYHWKRCQRDAENKVPIKIYH